MARILTNPTRRQRQVAEVRPSAAAEQQYRKRLEGAILAMVTSVEYWTLVEYRRALHANQQAGTVPDPDATMANDAGPTGSRKDLFRELANLERKWARYFDRKAKDWATGLVNAAYTANKAAWQARVRKEGFDIPMQLSAAQRTVLDVKVIDNVSLIKSIPEQYFKKIEGDVTRGFLAGRDLNAISKGLQKTGHSTRQRAALIARDQSNKLTAHMNSARQTELGIRYAYWKHSAAGKEPRPNHVRASREGWIFDTAVGIDFGDNAGLGPVLPGVPINCRCGGRSIIPAIDEDLGPDDLEPVAGFPGAYVKRKTETRKA